MYILPSAADNLKHLDLEGCYLGKSVGVALASFIEAHGQKFGNFEFEEMFFKRMMQLYV